MIDPNLRARLIRFELALANRNSTGIEGGLLSLIADDFLEFGSSGRTWTRDSIAAELARPTPAQASQPAVADQLEVAELGDGIALVISRGPAANRSSIWVRRDGRWQVRFHQGTPIRGDAERPPRRLRRTSGA